MGHINLSKFQLVTELSEVVGFKSGLIFSYKDLLKLFGDIYSKYIDGNIYSFIRIEASEYEEFYYEVLKNCGYMPKDIDPNELRFYTIHLRKKYGLGTKEFNIGIDIYKDYIDFLSNFLITNSQETKVINPTSFIELCKLKHGDFGVLIAIELLQMQNLSYHFKSMNCSLFYIKRNIF